VKRSKKPTALNTDASRLLTNETTYTRLKGTAPLFLEKR